MKLTDFIVVDLFVVDECLMFVEACNKFFYNKKFPTIFLFYPCSQCSVSYSGNIENDAKQDKRRKLWNGTEGAFCRRREGGRNLGRTPSLIRQIWELYWTLWKSMKYSKYTQNLDCFHGCSWTLTIASMIVSSRLQLQLLAILNS